MLKRVLILLAVSLGTLTIASSPAAAAAAGPGAAAADQPPWHLERTLHLAANPTEAMPITCISEGRVLAAGRYNWGFTLHQTAHDRWTELYLSAGHYTMTACLDPQQGFYTQTGILDPADPALATISIQESFTVPVDGSYLWGVFLNPLF